MNNTEDVYHFKKRIEQQIKQYCSITEVKLDPSENKPGEVTLLLWVEYEEELFLINLNIDTNLNCLAWICVSAPTNISQMDSEPMILINQFNKDSYIGESCYLFDDSLFFSRDGRYIELSLVKADTIMSMVKRLNSLLEELYMYYLPEDDEEFLEDFTDSFKKQNIEVLKSGVGSEANITDQTEREPHTIYWAVLMDSYGQRIDTYIQYDKSKKCVEHCYLGYTFPLSTKMDSVKLFKTIDTLQIDHKIGDSIDILESNDGVVLYMLVSKRQGSFSAGLIHGFAKVYTPFFSDLVKKINESVEQA